MRAVAIALIAVMVLTNTAQASEPPMASILTVTPKTVFAGDPVTVTVRAVDSEGACGPSVADIVDSPLDCFWAIWNVNGVYDFHVPANIPRGQVRLTMYESDRVSGDSKDGVYVKQMEIPLGEQPGKWELVYARVRDVDRSHDCHLLRDEFYDWLCGIGPLALGTYDITVLENNPLWLPTIVRQRVE